MIVRRDLSQSQQAVQGMHAAIEAARQGLIKSDTKHPHLVFCSVSDEFDLVEYSTKLESKGIRYQVFLEPDIGNKLTAIATEPIYGSNRKIFRNLKLVGA